MRDGEREPEVVPRWLAILAAIVLMICVFVLIRFVIYR